ncbi:MAG: hypothetical protein IKD69_08260 [Solobacterium sp.]|nr:hypothetical protein [Solobacterium sp.]
MKKETGEKADDLAILVKDLKYAILNEDKDEAEDAAAKLATALENE